MTRATLILHCSQTRLLHYSMRLTDGEVSHSSRFYDIIINNPLNVNDILITISLTEQFPTATGGFSVTRNELGRWFSFSGRSALEYYRFDIPMYIRHTEILDELPLSVRARAGRHRHAVYRVLLVFRNRPAYESVFARFRTYSDLPYTVM